MLGDEGAVHTGTLSASGAALGNDPDDLRAALEVERAARAQAEAVARQRDDMVAKLQNDLRDLARLRDNFHNLYREERELRAAAEQLADDRNETHGTLESEIASLSAEVDRLKRQLARQQPAPAAPVIAAAAAPSGADPRITDLERELGVIIAHAAELEAAVAERSAELEEATRRSQDLEREVAATRGQRTSASAPPAADAEPSAIQLRLHDMEGELAVLGKEHSDLRAAHDRLAAARQRLEEQLGEEQAQRAAADRAATEAGQRAAEAVRREAQAIDEAGRLRAAAESTDLALQAAKASIGVLEQRLRDAEQLRAAAEQRVGELEEELSFVRSSVLTGRSDAASRRSLLRRRTAPAGPIEATGTPVVDTTPVEVTGAPEDVEQALHRRLFGDS